MLFGERNSNMFCNINVKILEHEYYENISISKHG